MEKVYILMRKVIKTNEDSITVTVFPVVVSKDKNLLLGNYDSQDTYIVESRLTNV